MSERRRDLPWYLNGRDLLATVDFKDSISKHTVVVSRPTGSQTGRGVHITHAIKVNDAVLDAFVDRAALRVVAAAMVEEADRLDAEDAARKS